VEGTAVHRVNVALAILLTVAGAAIQPVVAGQAAPTGSPAPPLTVRGDCDAKGETPLIRVQIANKSDRPTAVVLGFNPNPQTHVVNSIHVIAIRPATGASDDYLYVNPKFALAKGTPWIVSLAPGATHDLELPLRDFISTFTYNPLDPSIVSGTRLVVDSRAASKSSTPVWTGKIETVLDVCRV
jgi:hypothetical protein